MRQELSIKWSNMNKQLPYEIKDDVIPTELRKEVWEYIRGLEHYAMLKDAKYPQVGTVIHYRPEENKKEYYDKSLPSWNNHFMHRVTFGNSEEELLIHRHRPIHRLWKAINAQFGNKFEIAGDKEGCYAKNDKNLMQRVYVNVQPNEEIKRSHGVHRDTIDLNEDKNYTLLYIANMEWYPTWFGELMFYENDDTCGDKQQYQKGWGQSRNFDVGYPFATIPSIPGRIIAYDGRILHTTRPVAEWADQFRYSLAFRVRLKD
jgi:hypothetical protein